jgi:hypothetical protein
MFSYNIFFLIANEVVFVLAQNIFSDNTISGNRADIAALYVNLLVSEEPQSLGEKLRANYEETQKLLLQVCLPKHTHFLHFV